MMAMYYVKEDLPGLARGRVERFLVTRAGSLGDAVEPYDEKKHGQALRKQEREDSERRQVAEEHLRLERENPDEFQRRELARRTALTLAARKQAAEAVKERLRQDELAER